MKKFMQVHTVLRQYTSPKRSMCFYKELTFKVQRPGSASPSTVVVHTSGSMPHFSGGMRCVGRRLGPADISFLELYAVISLLTNSGLQCGIHLINK
jgi:hypothetical protein